MPVKIERRGQVLYILVMHPRIDGENYILRALSEGNYFQDGYEAIEIDLDQVEYLNSLGITEFVGIHRRFGEASGGRSRMRLRNVERKVNAILDLVEMHKIADIHLKED
jgi:anti-anti-sigma regulatory factor